MLPPFERRRIPAQLPHAGVTGRGLLQSFQEEILRLLTLIAQPVTPAHATSGEAGKYQAVVATDRIAGIPPPSSRYPKPRTVTR